MQVHSSVANNQGRGIFASGRGTHLELKDCRASNNSGAAFQVETGSVLNAEGCNASHNGAQGFLARGSSTIICRSCASQENSADGMQAEQSELNLVGCSIFSNNLQGIRIRSSTNLSLSSGSLVEGNGLFGLLAAGEGTIAVIQDGTFLKNRDGSLRYEIRTFLNCARLLVPYMCVLANPFVIILYVLVVESLQYDSHDSSVKNVSNVYERQRV